MTASINGQTSECKTYKSHQAQVMTLIFFQTFIKLTFFSMTFSCFGHHVTQSFALQALLAAWNNMAVAAWLAGMSWSHVLLWNTTKSVVFVQVSTILYSFTKVTALHCTAQLLDKHFPLHSFSSQDIYPSKNGLCILSAFSISPPYCQNLFSPLRFTTLMDLLAFQKPISQFSHCPRSV